ncbi:hypothetical protein HCN44_007874 [Aphidius gifuensis]|uniref:Uncharacterized protein n=1 Tax=Aphidius gifuensis TaxID=684658 RepID=A0A834XV45_APHGI|nr:homeobox protein 5-like [Aphidius gifuensis]KAF7993371.1 hypothetical protein HCN44_007874 [Aphidius gifuensis]
MSGRTKVLSKTNPVQKLSSSSRINSMLAKSANIIQSAQHVIDKQNERLKSSTTWQDRPSGIRVSSPRLKSFPAEEIRKSRPTRSCEFITDTPKLNEKTVKNLSTTQIKSNNNKVLSQQHQQRLTNPSSNESINRVLYFTPAMIHDQELLVSTLRQHGISEDIMKRQFDSLLAEQKKQLFYLDQLQNHEVDSPSDSKNNTQRRRISRLDDGKPEWMARITPPWISYATLDNEINNSNTQMHEIRSNEQVVCQPDANLYELQKQQQQQQQPEIGFTHQHYNQNPNTHTQNGDTDISMRVCDHNNDNHLESRSNNANNNRLPVRVYNDIMKKQKQNNGLQDPETIKLAMEMLKNPRHQKGLEYVEKLNRKNEIVKLNGVQDPDETYQTHQNYSNIVDNKMNTKICANGLENTRNSNNPISASLLQLKKNFNEPVYAEYPRRKINSVILPAERENGTIANSVSHDNQHYAPIIQNPQIEGTTADYTMANNSPQQTQDIHQVQASGTEPHNCRRVSFNIDNAPQVVDATDCATNHAHNHQQQSIHQVQENGPEHHECCRVPLDINTPRAVGGADCTLANHSHNYQPQNIHQVQQNEYEPHQCHRVPFNYNQPQVVGAPDCTMTNHPHHHQPQDIYQTQGVESEPHQCRRVSFNTNQPQAVDTTNYTVSNHPHQTQDVYKIQGNEPEHYECCRVPFNTNQAQEQIMQNHNQEFQAILEPKIIGGVQYFTIKPAYFPNNNSTHQ